MAVTVLLPLWGPALVQAQTAAPAGARWWADLEQGRMSAVLTGDVIDDARQLRRADGDSVRSWARNRLSLGRQAPNHGQDVSLTWSSTLVQEAHVRGTGAQAGVRLNQSAGPAGAQYPFDLQSVQHRRWDIAALLQLSSAPLWGAGEPVRWHVGGRLLAVDRYKSISASGVLQDTHGGNLGLQARSRSDELGGTSNFVQPDKALGWGVTLDLGVEGGSLGQGQWALAVRDLGPSVKLRHVLGDDKTADTNTLSFDADGLVNFAPVLSGRYVDREARVRIEPEWTARYTHPVYRNGQAMVGVIWHGARQELSLGYQHQWGAQQLTLTAHALRDMPFSVGLRWDMAYGSLGWRGDRLSAGKARVWMLEGGLRF